MTCIILHCANDDIFGENCSNWLIFHCANNDDIFCENCSNFLILHCANDDIFGEKKCNTRGCRNGFGLSVTSNFTAHHFKREQLPIDSIWQHDGMEWREV